MHLHQPVQRLLIGIDFTEDARTAFYWGLQMAAQWQADTWVVHVAEPLKAFDVNRKRYIETLHTIERIEEGFHRRVDELWEEDGLEGIDRRRVHLLVRGGQAATEIVNAAHAKEAQLIVIGRGTTAGKLGNTADQILHRASCAVFCVPSQASMPS